MIYHKVDSIKEIREKEEAKQEQAEQIKMLPLQIQATSDRQDFIEDCIAEMAMALYP